MSSACQNGSASIGDGVDTSRPNGWSALERFCGLEMAEQVMLRPGQSGRLGVAQWQVQPKRVAENEQIARAWPQFEHLGGRQ